MFSLRDLQRGNNDILLNEFSNTEPQVQVSLKVYIMESRTDSEDSVIESSVLQTGKDLLSEATSNQSRKEQFKGFYKTQLTIANSSNSSMDTESQTDQKVLTPGNDETEDTHFEFDGVLEDLKELAIPKIMKNSVVMEDLREDHLTTVIHSSNIEADPESSSSYNNTSEDEVSEMAVDPEILSQRQSLGEVTLKGSFSEESLVSVSDIDYYKIRHETHFHNERRISLVLSPYHLITKVKSFDDGDENTPYHHPSLPCVKVLDAEDLCDDGGDTSDEDINCNESDFMTMAEFLEAYRTNVDLGQNEVNLKISHSQHHGRPERHQEEEASTHSECESLGSGSGEELDSCDTDDNLIHSEDCINLRTEMMEHSEDCIYRKADSFYTGQHILIQSEQELPGDREDLSDEEKTCISELNEVGPDMTDEELVSDVERKTKQADPRNTTTSELTVGSRKSRVKKRGNKNKKKKNETNN